MATPDKELEKKLRRASLAAEGKAPAKAPAAAAAAAGSSAQPSPAGSVTLTVKAVKEGAGDGSVKVRVVAKGAVPDGARVKVETAYNTVAATLLSFVGTVWEVASDSVVLQDGVAEFNCVGLTAGTPVQVRASLGLPGAEGMQWQPPCAALDTATVTAEDVAARKAAKAARLAESQARAAAASAAARAEREAAAAVAARGTGPAASADAATGVTPAEEVAALPSSVAALRAKFGDSTPVKAAPSPAELAAAAAAETAAEVARLGALMAAQQAELDAARAAVDGQKALTEEAQAAAAAAVSAAEGRARALAVQVEVMEGPGPQPALEAELVEEGHSRVDVRGLLSIFERADGAFLRRLLARMGEVVASTGLSREEVRQRVALFHLEQEAREGEGAADEAAGDALMAALGAGAAAAAP